MFILNKLIPSPDRNGILFINCHGFKTVAIYKKIEWIAGNSSLNKFSINADYLAVNLGSDSISVPHLLHVLSSLEL
jgi:hypothetical protein